MAGTTVEILSAAGRVGGEAGAGAAAGEGPALAEGDGEARADLPAFLQNRYELPPGYENTKGRWNYIRVGREGTVCYFGPHAIRFSVSPKGKIFFEPEQYEMPPADSDIRVEQNELGIEITDGEYPTTDVFVKLPWANVAPVDSIQRWLNPGYSAGDPQNDDVYFNFPRDARSEENVGSPAIIWLTDVSDKFAQFEQGKVVHFGCENIYLNFAIPSAAKIDPQVILGVVHKDQRALAELEARIPLPVAREEEVGAAAEAASKKAEQRELPEMTKKQRESLETFMKSLGALADLESNSGQVAETTLSDLRAEVLNSLLGLHGDIREAVYIAVASQLGRKRKEGDIGALTYDWLDSVVDAIRERRRK